MSLVTRFLLDGICVELYNCLVNFLFYGICPSNPLLFSLTADVRQNDGSEGVPIVAEQTPTTPLSPVPKQSGATQQPSQREDATSKRSCEQLTCCGCPLLLTSEDRVNNEKFCIDCRAAQTTMVQDEEQLAISKSYVQTGGYSLLHSTIKPR